MTNGATTLLTSAADGTSSPPAILEALASRHRELAAGQARQLGLLDPDGPGSWTHPDLSRMLYADGKVITPLFRAKPGDTHLDRTPARTPTTTQRGLRRLICCSTNPRSRTRRARTDRPQRHRPETGPRADARTRGRHWRRSTLQRSGVSRHEFSRPRPRSSVDRASVS